MSKRTKENLLYFGDNLEVMKQHLKSESIDLVYLDPPFNSNQDYNVLFAEQNGSNSASQFHAFEDTWHWDQTAAAAYEMAVEAGGNVALVMQAFRKFLGGNDVLAYLSMMAPRLVELRRVMKPTASIYLHCDTTAGHYLKMLMDAVFGPVNFKTEIVWKRTSAHSDSKQGRKQHGRIHDVLLFYTKSDEWTWNPVYTPYDKKYLDSSYRHIEKETGRRYRLDNLTGPGGKRKGNPQYEVMGVIRYWRYSQEKMQDLIKEGRVIQTRPGGVPAYKRYLDEMPGVTLQDVWTDIPPIGSRAKERLGYPTQKPVALLERIIESSSNKGDTVLDPFCGCGTTVAAAHNLKRRWIGIDITHLAVSMIRYRLQDSFGKKCKYRVVGEPVAIPDAETLAREDPYQFQWWALGLVGARPVEEKKGADKGIDGRLFFHDEPTGKGKTKQIVISVKAGRPGVAHVRDLRGVLEREEAELGVLISFREPTKQMRAEAAGAAYYESSWGKHPRLQILTIAELLAGKGIDYPPAQDVNVTFKKARKQEPDSNEEQTELF